jgi:two-component system KDP operon response regulator KdpE
MTPRILVVDDDPTLLRFFGEYLAGEGFQVLTAQRGEEALKILYNERPHLAVIDVMMPGMDGWELCARLREMASLPIILLTAKSTETDKLRGFRLGIDDYVTKPFSLAEMTARIRAVLARAASPADGEQRVYRLGDLVVDLNRRVVRRGGEEITLTPIEFRLLEVLLEKSGSVVSEAELLKHVWGALKHEDSSAVRRYIWFLRQKLEQNPTEPQHILTVRGFGYRLGTGPLTPIDGKEPIK